MDVYFSTIYQDNKTSEKNEAITLNMWGSSLIFHSDNASKMITKTMRFITNGLNHLLAWADDNDMVEFVNDFCNYMMFFKGELASDKFTREVNMKLPKLKKGENITDIGAEALRRTVSNMPDSIIDGIIKYVDDNSFNNTQETLIPNNNLDEIDILVLNTVITIAKIITIGYTMLPASRIGFYIYDPIVNMIDVVSNRVALNHFPNVVHDLDKYMIMTKKNVAEDIYNFMYININGNEENEDNVMSKIFKDNGSTKNRLNDEKYMQVITAIYKFVPIEYKNIATTNQYDYGRGDNYDDFKFVSRTTIGYIKTIITHTNNHKNMITNPHMVNTHEMANGNSEDDYASSLKQELYLEKKNMTDVKNRRSYIELIKKYCDNYLEKHNVEIRSIIEPNPLGNHFIIKMLQEVSEDYLSLKMVDVYTYTKFIYLISHKLFDKYPMTSMALKYESTIKSYVYYQHKDIQEQIENLDIYKRFPEVTSKDLEEIIGNAYRVNDSVIDICEEFIKYLYDVQNNKFDIKFIEDYIYDYEEQGI